MRTSIFSEFTGLKDEFHRDLRTFWSLSPGRWTSLLHGAMRVLRADTKGEERKAIEETVADMEGNPVELLPSLNVLYYVCRQWNPVKDTPGAFLEDMRSLSLIPKDKEDEASRFIEEMLATLEKDKVRRLKKMYANSLLPAFIGANTLVDIRPVFDKPFGSDTDDKVDEYEPVIIDFAPVVLVKILRDSGLPQEVAFQCEERDVRNLIEQLTAALKELDTATRHLGIKGEEKPQ